MFQVELHPKEEEESEDNNEPIFSFTARTLRTCVHLPALSSVAFVITLGRSVLVSRVNLETATFAYDSPELQNTECELLTLLESTSLNEVVITPIPNPFRFDYNASLPQRGLRCPNTWTMPRFPLQFFAKIREAGKLNVMGTIPGGSETANPSL